MIHPVAGYTVVLGNGREDGEEVVIVLMLSTYVLGYRGKLRL